MSLEDQMEHVIELMTARASGEASTAAVEAAVNQVLVATGQASPKEPEIEEDLSDYDDNDDADKKEDKKPPSRPPPPPQPAVRKRGRPRKHPQPQPPIDFTPYADIPLGKQGAQMMATFGDHREPLPETVSTVLLGARRMLQAAIVDARVVYRRQAAIFKSVQLSIDRHRPRSPKQQAEWSAELVFRAQMGHDVLSRNHKCGFGVDELKQLFPEEMNAYDRWAAMHAASEKGKSTSDDVAAEETELEEEDLQLDSSGQMMMRMEQFDRRTDRMADESYLQFADLRQGSFLPRRVNAAAERAWEAQRPRSRGRPSAGSWAHMNAVAVRFLHWVGFDPQSVLQPPDEDTTAALAFIAYNFFGQIVEKAILLRNLKKRKVDEANVVLELDAGEKLTVEDIDSALDHPEIRTTPMYSEADDKKKVIPQLYFGPGFEDRLEMEMEEMLAKPSEEELRIRKEEDALFASLAAPPAKNGLASLLDMEDDGQVEEKKVEAKPRAKRAKKDLTPSKSAKAQLKEPPAAKNGDSVGKGATKAAQASAKRASVKMPAKKAPAKTEEPSARPKRSKRLR